MQQEEEEEEEEKEGDNSLPNTKIRLKKAVAEALEKKSGERFLEKYGTFFSLRSTPPAGERSRPLTTDPDSVGLAARATAKALL